MVEDGGRSDARAEDAGCWCGASAEDAGAMRGRKRLPGRRPRRTKAGAIAGADGRGCRHCGGAAEIEVAETVMW
jgi:hypothetical protein